MSLTLLEKVRNVPRPTREAMLQRDASVHRFWNENKKVFEEAWTEWELKGGHGQIRLDDSLYAPKLRHAIEQSWENPHQEVLVKDIWTEVFPNVYKAQFFDPEKLYILREYMRRVSDAEIPLRPPYGIVLNRGGAMLDPRSEGYLAAPTFQSFYRNLMNQYMRPISRVLFPDVYGFDSQTFGFSIAWQAGKDTTLRPHTDASSVTLNINLNLPDEKYSGSAVRFIDPISRRVESLTFDPGTALIHHGNVGHASEPITEGERHNFVLWLYGEGGQVPHQYAPRHEHVTAHQRWTKPSVEPDKFAPF
ncbi:2OG-Fe(II) oxygenase [Hirschia litorea]|uniref:2OG-Fe(II) oxygenase n=1 Tax=Hirschia litorea TaxID=1199156 RepID=A0ABW2INP8_9PROT